MASVNKVILIGRLTRDPETRSFASGGKVAQFGFAVNGRKKGPDGTYVDDPCFIDCKAFNSDNGRKLADTIEHYLSKGQQVYLEGKLVMESWQDKDTGAKRSKLVVVVYDMQFLERKEDGPGAGAGRKARAEMESGDDGGAGLDIPF